MPTQWHQERGSGSDNEARMTLEGSVVTCPLRPPRLPHLCSHFPSVHTSRVMSTVTSLKRGATGALNRSTLDFCLVVLSARALRHPYSHLLLIFRIFPAVHTCRAVPLPSPASSCFNASLLSTRAVCPHMPCVPLPPPASSSHSIKQSISTFH